MTAVTAQTCRCGLVMRTCATWDAWECRCGATLDAQAVYSALHSGGSIPDDAWKQGEPWKEHAPGLRVSNDFADIGPLCWEWTILAPSVIEPAALDRACADAFECSGLRYAGRIPGGRRLEIDGETLTRRRMYAIAPLGQEAKAIRAVVQAIRVLDGPGRLWTQPDPPIGPMQHYGDPLGYRASEIGGVMHVVLRCYYFHKPDGAK